MDNWLFNFIITFIVSFFLLFGLGALIGGENIEFTYVVMFVLQFSFTTSLLFYILSRLKRLEKEETK